MDGAGFADALLVLVCDGCFLAPLQAPLTLSSEPVLGRHARQHGRALRAPLACHLGARHCPSVSDMVLGALLGPDLNAARPVCGLLEVPSCMLLAHLRAWHAAREVAHSVGCKGQDLCATLGILLAHGVPCSHWIPWSLPRLLPSRARTFGIQALRQAFCASSISGSCPTRPGGPAEHAHRPRCTVCDMVQLLGELLVCNVRIPVHLLQCVARPWTDQPRALPHLLHGQCGGHCHRCAEACAGLLEQIPYWPPCRSLCAFCGARGCRHAARA
mmetsp:Transcript_98015/g.315340  ORF Transcript_98015/g.315340 Transcript_98015/m.315340 type:complete len:272 (+) Transcript_98015:3816-4631(+)